MSNLIQGQKKKTPPHPLTNPMLRWPIRHPQYLKNSLLTPRQQPHTPIKDIVPREINHRRTHFLPRHEQEIHSTPHARSRQTSRAVPFGSGGGVVGRGGEARAEVFAAEEQRDHGRGHDGPQDRERRPGLGDDEVDIARIGRPAAVAASDGQLQPGSDPGEDVAEVFGVGVDFRAGDAGEEVFEVGDAGFLVFGRVGVLGEVVQGAEALVDPGGGLGDADAVDFEEELQGDVLRLEGDVVEVAEAVGPDDFFDFRGEARADEGDCEGLVFGCDFGVLFP